jgi:transposase
MDNYNAYSSAYQVVLPLAVEVLIPQDESVRTLVSVLEQIDFCEEARSYARRRHRTPFIIMLRVVVYGFMRGIRSVRGIEAACRENINFMWLLEGYPVPDHNTVARFIAATDCSAVLVKVNKYLTGLGELTFKHAFIDGTKIEANANRYTFVWKGTVEKNLAKLLPKAKALLAELNVRYNVGFSSLDGVVNHLEYLDFKHAFGKGSRKSQEQRDLETARDCVNRLRKYEAALTQIGSKRKSMSKTDPGATFMRLKEDQMKNGQLKPAYNVQLCIESEYITGFYVSADRNDTGTLKPFLEKLHSEYGKRHENVTLDSGYESEENYVYLKEKGQAGYVKPQNYEQQKTRKYKNQIGRKENMRYDPASDTYTCANGKKLTAAYTSLRKSASGYEQTVTTYRCENCVDCPVRKLCTKAKDDKPKELECSRLFERLRAESFKRITSENGIQLRVNRSIQAEGVFGVLKQDYAFRRFSRRSQSAVTAELALVCTAHNLNKLHHHIFNDRLGFSLHEIPSG